MHATELFREEFFNLVDGVDQVLPGNGKLYIRANANQVVVTFRHKNDSNNTYARLATVPANDGVLLDNIFPTKNGIIRVTGGTAFLVLYKD